jgi:hypothetical protein
MRQGARLRKRAAIPGDRSGVATGATIEGLQVAR